MSGLPGTNMISSIPVRHTRMDEPVSAGFLSIDEHVVGTDTSGVTLVAGRNFTPATAGNPERGVILNETAARSLGYRTPTEAVGAFLTVGPYDNAQVIGVVKDFHFSRIRLAIAPLVLMYIPENPSYATVHIQPDRVREALDQIEMAWSRLNRPQPVEYRFYDDQITGDNEMLTFRDFFTIVGMLAGGIVVIALLGILGMTIYNTETRIKEIGVRKVLGADMTTIVLLLSRDFLKLLGVAIVVATPAAYLLNAAWLQGFLYRVTLSPWIFVMGVLVTVLLTLLAIGAQTLKAARSNPVHTLRYE